MFLLVFWNIIYFDLAALSDSLFIFNHSFTLSSSLLIELHRSRFKCPAVNAFKVLDNVVSSAYMIKLKILLALGKSLIYRIKSKGPKIDPWGTPVITGNVVDLVSSICIYYCSRFSR